MNIGKCGATQEISILGLKKKKTLKGKNYSLLLQVLGDCWDLALQDLSPEVHLMGYLMSDVIASTIQVCVRDGRTFVLSDETFVEDNAVAKFLHSCSQLWKPIMRNFEGHYWFLLKVLDAWLSWWPPCFCALNHWPGTSMQRRSTLPHLCLVSKVLGVSQSTIRISASVAWVFFCFLFFFSLMTGLL